VTLRGEACLNKGNLSKSGLSGSTGIQGTLDSSFDISISRLELNLAV
jgi:hypothetical protein